MRSLVMVSLVIMAVLTGCGDGTEDDGATDDPTTASSDPSEATPRSTEKPPRPGTVVTTAHSDYGTMLFDESGQAIYLFDKEVSERPRCYRTCAEAWPPVMTEGEPQAAGRAKQKLLGTTERKDGGLQVTYAAIRSTSTPTRASTRCSATTSRSTAGCGS